MEDIAIKVEHASKNFLLPHQRVRSVKSAFTGLFKTKKGTAETQHALRDVSLEVKKGEFFGIVGRNGSGKSTLLKMLAGIYQPSKGTVATYGKLVPFIELGVGFNPELTGRENIYLNGALLGFSAKEIDAQYDDIVRFAELEEFMDQKLKNYSSGMQVRLAFSTAIRANGDILLVDEVLAVGDADFQRKCFDYFRSLKKTQKTVIFISHDMDAVRQFCDRAMLINEGTVKSIGNVEEVAQGYTKLFMTVTEQDDSKESKHWGEAVGSLGKPKVVLGKDIAIHGSITPKETVENPTFGFVVRNATGTAVLGTNNTMLRTKLGTMHKGKTYGVVWGFPDILSDGRYTLDIALLKEDGNTVLEWWSAAATFSVKKPTMSPYPVTPEIKLKVTPAQGASDA